MLSCLMLMLLDTGGCWDLDSVDASSCVDFGNSRCSRYLDLFHILDDNLHVWYVLEFSDGGP